MGKQEGIIEDYLINQAKKNKMLCYKFVSPGENGVPDRIVIYNGYVVFVELKKPGEDARPLQKAVIKKMKSRGAEVHVIDSKPLVDKLMQDLLHR